MRLMSQLLILGLLSGCATLPEDYPKQESFAVPASAETPLGISATAWVSSHDGQSGFFPLHSGSDALAARLRMIERAEVSLDAQYFLMKPDIAGHVFSQELLLAADRGVRVRFLLDDIFTKVRDEELFILDAHENIEVRLYNPNTCCRHVLCLQYSPPPSIPNNRPLHQVAHFTQNSFNICFRFILSAV